MEAKKTHTPGPWKIGELSNEILSPRGYAVAAVPDSAGEPELEQWAIDARLIAAAPELLEALSDLLAKVAYRQDQPLGGRPMFTGLELVRFRSIIAKARGGA